MKRAMLIFATMVLALCLYQPAECQGQMFGAVGAGMAFEEEGAFAAFGAFDIPLYTDTLRNFSVFSRTGYQFDRRNDDDENQQIFVWQMVKRNPTNWLYVAIGGGLTYEIKEGADNQAAGIKLEFGLMPLPGFAFIIGADYLPDASEDAKDIQFVYCGINLLP